LPPLHFAHSSSRSKLTVYLQAMHAGVIRDVEQQRVKKERQADFEMQKALEEEYRKVQKVHDGGEEGAQGGQGEKGRGKSWWSFS